MLLVKQSGTSTAKPNRKTLINPFPRKSITMGVYDKKNSTGFDYFFPTQGTKIMGLGLAIVGALLILLLLAMAVGVFSPRPLSFSFDKNPVKSSEQSILTVSVSNPYPQTARKVIVEVVPEDRRAISVDRPVREIDVLDKNRELEFIINPVGKILPGDYVLNISVTINGTKFSETATLKVIQ